MVKSPLTNKPAILIKKLSVEGLKNSYQKFLNLEISHLMGNYKMISIYKCPDTGYRFFYPFDVAGDGKFYEHLQEYEWYYMLWKWEHKETAKLLKNGMKILEIGCAQGEFLKKIQQENGVEATGLELNKKAADQAAKSGLHVLIETIQEHAMRYNGNYDMVCSFQVLEHIGDVRAFLEAQIDCLKEGGKLIICVPNNDSFIKYENGGVLNYPPHHMGWWDSHSLQKIQELFPLKLEEIKYEPLQEHHFNWYIKLWAGKYLKVRVLKSIFFRFKFSELFKLYVQKRAKNIRGHSIMAIYTKV